MSRCGLLISSRSASPQRDDSKNIKQLCSIVMAARPYDPMTKKLRLNKGALGSIIERVRNRILCTYTLKVGRLTMKLLRAVLAIVIICVLAIPVEWSMGRDNTFLLQPPGAPDSHESLLWMLNQRESRQAISELPFVINESGSYFVTGTLTGTNGMDGITINADDVKLDLNGFALNGVPGSYNGVTVVPPKHNITIKNGVVRGWGGYGIQALGADDCAVAGVKAHANEGGGIRMGKNSLVKNCIAYANGSAASSDS